MGESLSPFSAGISENPALEAQKLLSQVGWEGELPIDLRFICEANDYELSFESWPERKEIGWSSITDNGLSRIVVNTKTTTPEDDFALDDTKRRRQRFTLAHEIGHCTMKSHKDTQLQRRLTANGNPHANYYHRTREVEADNFAAHLLMPTDHFKKYLRKASFKNFKPMVEKICDTYDVSLMTALLRLPQCANFACMTILFSKQGNVMRIPGRSDDAQDERFYFDKDSQPPVGTVVFDMWQGRNDHGYTSKRYQDCATWFPEFYRQYNYTMVEHTFNLGQFGFATFLEMSEQEYT